MDFYVITTTEDFHAQEPAVFTDKKDRDAVFLEMVHNYRLNQQGNLAYNDMMEVKKWDVREASL